MEPPASNRLGLAEPVSRTEGNKPSPGTLLGDARQEYIAAARHGRGGRDVQARYSGRSRCAGAAARGDRPRALRRRHVDLRARRVRPAGAVPSLRHRSADPLRGRDGAERGALRRRVPPAALGSRADRRPARPRARRFRPSSTWATPSSCSRCSTSGSSPAMSGSFSGSTAGCAASPPTTGGSLLDALLQLVDERHTPFNEHGLPARARHQERAGRAAGYRGDAAHPAAQAAAATDAELDRAARQLQDAEDFFQRVRSILHLESSRDVNVLTPRAAGESGRDVRLRGPAVAAAGGNADGGVLPPRAAVGAGARPRAARGHRRRRGMSVSRHVGRHFEITRRRRSLPRSHARGDAAVAVARALPDRALERLRGVGAGADLHRAEHRALRPGRLHGDRRRSAARAQHALPAARALCAPDRDARLRAARPRLPGVRAHSRPRHPRLLTTSTPSTSTRCSRFAAWSRCGIRTNPSQQRFSSILQELHAPELLTLALLFHDVGKWRDTEHVQESVQLAQSMLDRLELPTDARRTVEFLIRNHLLMSQVAFRRDFDDPHVVKQFADLVGIGGAAQDAVPDDARRRRRREPRHADAVEGRPAVAALRPRLQPPHPRLCRRAAAEGSCGPLGRRRRASRRHHRGRAHDLSEGPAAPLSDALRPGVHLPARAPGARHPQGRSPRRPRTARRRVGADASSRSTSRISSRTSPACCPISAWTSTAARR